MMGSPTAVFWNRFYLSADGSPAAQTVTTFIEDMYASRGDHESIHLNFTQICNCSVNFTVWNAINTVVHIARVVVQDPVVGKTVGVASPLAIEMNQTRTQGTFTITANSDPVGTDMNYLIDSGETPNVVLAGDVTGIVSAGDVFTVTHDYENVGNFCAVVNISNLVDFHMYSGGSLCTSVEQRIENVAVSSDQNKGRTFTTTFTLTTTMDWGTGFQVLADFKDGSSSSTEHSIYSESIMHTHIYTSPGVYRPDVTVTNVVTPSATPVSMDGVLIVQNAVDPDTYLAGRRVTILGHTNNFREDYFLTIKQSPGSSNCCLTLMQNNEAC